MNLNKSFLLGAFSAFFGLLVFFEIFLHLTVPAGFWYRHFDISGDMTSLAEIRDRIRFAAPPDHRILLLGDSVLGASALMEHRIPDARSKTLSSLLKRSLGEADTNAISLGSDGLLLADIEGLTTEFSAAPPEKILLLLNFRMFSKEFGEGPKALSRNFLFSDLPGEIQKRLIPDQPPTPEAQLSDRLYAGMCNDWFLFRETQMLKTLWYYPSQKDFFQRLLEEMVGKNDAQSDMIEAALKQKIASYYQPYLWDQKALPFTCLKMVLDQWTGKHISVDVILTPQNQKFLGSYLDKSSFEKNRKTLAAFMKNYAYQGVTYQDWADRFATSAFLDHCHLTPEGNEQYAGNLIRFLGKGTP
jgi:hypothetical protein